MSENDRTQAAKRWLSDYRDLCCRRDALADELDRLRAATTRATGHLSQAHVQRIPAHGSFEERSLELVEAQDRLKTLIDHISESLAVRLALIEQLSDERRRLVLTLRYINGLEWFKVEHAMHYERRQVFYFHSEALKEVAALMENGFT
jgi:DNA-directed RNA polymerase specialized sigma subunit